MKVDVRELAIVVATPVCNIAYSPGVHLAPRAHIEQIEAQGKGARLPGADEADMAAEINPASEGE